MSRRFFPLMLLAAGLAACEDEQPTFLERRESTAPDLRSGVPPLDVYTHNVYLGGDTGPLFSLDFTNIPAVLAATNAFWQQVGNSATPERMAAIVDEIDVRRPHVVGLQEVLRFVIIENNAVVGGLDLLALIEAEIAARGLPYTTEVVQPATSATLPLAITNTGLRALNFTDRVVILRRNDVTLTAEASGQYAAAYSLGPVTLRRGWARVSLDYHGTLHHFVTTHLEVQGLAPVQAGQTQQLLNQVVAGLTGVTIVAGDLNSDAAAAQGDPSWTNTYDVLRAAGFQDVWTLAPFASRSEGFTCCQANDLRNPVSELDERIDFVLVRSSEGVQPGEGFGRGHYRIEVVGDQPGDRTASGLWPADHAGLAASISTASVE